MGQFGPTDGKRGLAHAAGSVNEGAPGAITQIEGLGDPFEFIGTAKESRKCAEDYRSVATARAVSSPDGRGR